MRRRLFNFASSVSTAFLVGSLLLWYPSYQYYAGVRVIDNTNPNDWNRREWFAYAGRYGYLTYNYNLHTVETFESTGRHWIVTLGATQPPRTAMNILRENVEEAENGPTGRRFGGTAWAGGEGMETLVFPIWIAVAIFAFLPAVRAFRALQSRRPIIVGHCMKCSYNLTGNTSGVCPECGTPITWSRV